MDSKYTWSLSTVKGSHGVAGVGTMALLVWGATALLVWEPRMAA